MGEKEEAFSIMSVIASFKEAVKIGKASNSTHDVRKRQSIMPAKSSVCMCGGGKGQSCIKERESS